MRFKRWHVFPIISILWFTQVAALCDPGNSSTGADTVINGNGNQICQATVVSGEKTELVTVDCGLNPPLAVTPEDPGTSQFEPTPE